MKKTKMKLDRKVVMQEANALVRTTHLTRSAAVRQGWKLARLAAIFAAGLAASITFIKKDGTIRAANALPAKTGECLLTGTGKRTPKANMLFVDADICEFRSFVKANLLTVA